MIQKMLEEVKTVEDLVMVVDAYYSCKMELANFDHDFSIAKAINAKNAELASSLGKK